jgi:mono/diheme cytochrome c family protein
MPRSNPGDRRPTAGLRRAAGTLALAGAAVALWAGTLPTIAAPLPQDERPRSGGQYWAGRYGCVACHGGRGEGTPIGPQLVGRPDSPLSYDLVLDRVRTPLLIMPDFPASVVSDDKVQAIVDYFHSFEPAR